MAVEIKTQVGRIVWGNPAKAQIKKYQEGPQKGQPVLKDGVPVNQWAFGVAFPKAEFQRDIWPAMAQEAANGYPNGTPQKFAWKYQDGDGIDSNGQPFNKREGYAGCYVLTVSTEAFAPPIYKWAGSSYVQLQPNEIKTGDFVALALTVKLNIPTDRTRTPSLYINPLGIEFVAYGQEIQNGPDPMALFGGQQRQLPPGASATPIAPNNNIGMPGTNNPASMQPQPSGMPGQMPMQQPGMMPNGPQMQPGAPQPGYQQPQPGYTPPHDPRFTGGPQPGQMPMQQPGMMQPQQQYQQPVQPAHDFVHNAGHQQPGMMQPAPGGYQQPQQQYQQPGQMPGMMPPNR